MEDFWVFGYGSLIWRPGFDYEERAKARLAGYHRSLCVHSYVHRGTPERPGLVFGLDRGGSCVGMAFRVDGPLRQKTLDYLRARELVTNVYREAVLPVRMADGRQIRAVTYIVDRGHAQYAGKVDAAQAARIVSNGHGQSGPNVDYVKSAHEHIAAMGLKDRWLQDVVSRL